MSMKVYVEDFRDGSSGWAGHQKALEIDKGFAISRSPWWVDPNHAYPGGGYLHLLYVLWTTDTLAENNIDIAGVNRFVKGGFPTDFRNASVSVRIKGELYSKGAKLRLLAQSQVGDRRINSVLVSQSIEVNSEWSDQTIHLPPDDSQWLCIGSRHDMTDQYGYGPIEDVLKDLNLDIILVLHGLDVTPIRPVDGDPDIMRAGVDYEVDYSRLPSGYVMVDEIRIEFAVD